MYNKTEVREIETISKMSSYAERLEKKALEALRKMRPLDDTLMREMFRDCPEFAEPVLRIITGKPDLELVKLQTQYDIKRAEGARSVCLDVLAVDGSGTLYDIEIQRADGGAAPKRARYHSSVMDVEFLDKGEDFETLPCSYVIFITENDVLGGGRAVYPIERVNTAMNCPFGDDEHILYLNASYDNKDDLSDIAMLMHDFRCVSPDDMHFEFMEERTRYFKENEKGESGMCKIVEDLGKEVAEWYVNERELAIAKSLLNMGYMPMDKIAEASGVPLEMVEELAREIENEQQNI